VERDLPAYDPDAAPLADAGLFGLPFTPDDARCVIVPVPWDATTSYRAGTSRGPGAIRIASHQLDLHDPQLGDAWRAGIAMLPFPEDIAAWNAVARADAERVIEVGGRIAGDRELEAALARVNAASAKLDAHVYDEVAALVARGKLVGVLGGDHSVPFGAMRAHAEREPGAIGVLHVDAHADLREAYEGFARSHASIMYNVLHELPIAKLVQVGIRDFASAEATLAANDRRVVQFRDDQLAEAALDGVPWRQTCERIARELPAQVYVSFDIDGLDPSLCPNTGTPVPGGLSFQQAALLLRHVVEAGKQIVGFDLNEVAPGRDGDDWDANVGARVLYKLCGWALRSQPVR
jgi:agmatinase